jgi:glyoxylase-like metal-dependent hydrolase (beta-lactamase superfamily II)
MMNNEFYHFNVGDFECVAISDGTFTYTPPVFPPPATALFVNAPKEQLEQTLLNYSLHANHWIEWTSTYICLVIKTGDYTVLVDTGAGNLAPTTGKLVHNMKSEGISPEDIDIVLITHAHPDHIGGNITSEGKSAFPNARYFMWEDEWYFWTSERAELELDDHMAVPLNIARMNLPTIRGQLELIDQETEIMPGVSVIEAPGHTPGHMALTVNSRDEGLLILSDTILHPIHIEQPQWYSIFDFDPKQSIPSRQHLLNKAMVDKALVLAFHFTFPGLGYVIQKGKGWHWLPIDAKN